MRSNENLPVLLETALLSQKVRFPLLEYAAVLLMERIKKEEQLKFCDALTTGLSMGSWVIAGKMLQLRLDEDRMFSLKKAAEYILKGNTWYACDIVVSESWEMPCSDTLNGCFGIWMNWQRERVYCPDAPEWLPITRLRRV